MIYQLLNDFWRPATSLMRVALRALLNGWGDRTRALDRVNRSFEHRDREIRLFAPPFRHAFPCDAPSMAGDRCPLKPGAAQRCTR